MSRKLKYAAGAFVAFWVVTFAILCFAVLGWPPFFSWSPVVRGYLMFCALLISFAVAVNTKEPVQ